jgi:para-nitrobenzyl esterase
MAKEEMVCDSRGRSRSKSMTTIQRRSRACNLERIAKPLLVLLCGFSLAQMIEPARSAGLTTESASTPLLSSDQTLVVTSTGSVRGTLHDGVREFKGIPYAAPPTGKLRWKLPQPAKPWKGVLDATRYGNECPRLSRYGLTEAAYNEDCLFLNVTIPEMRSPATVKLSVIVWIHGGAFVGGSSSLYPLAHLALSGHLVVVSFNYRLGVFGLMGHPAFDRDYDGSYGLEDQRAAMRWVQRNIAAFGGAPGNVTIAGESAGAGSVCMHLLAPQGEMPHSAFHEVP